MCLPCPKSTCSCCGGSIRCVRKYRRFRDFNTLIDSGMIGRVRELKQWLDSSFYHPGVLATVSAYNATFGKKFDELFAKALGEIKTFGQALEEMGGTILTTVDGVEVTVDHVAAIEGKQLLQADYGSTLEKFRRVSKLKKELDRRPPIRRSLLTPAAQASRPAGGAAAAQRRRKPLPAQRKRPAPVPVFQPPAVTRSTAFRGRRQAAARRGIDSSVCAGRRSEVPPGCSDALFQPDFHCAGSRRLQRAIPGRKKSARRRGAHADPHGIDLRAHQHRTGRTEAQPEDVLSVEAACRLRGGAARYGQHVGRGGRRHWEDGPAERSGCGGRAIHESAQKLRNHADIAVKTLANVS